MLSEIIRIFKPFLVYTAILFTFVQCGKYTAKKHPDIWKKFFPMFGYCVAAFNFYAAYILMKTAGAAGINFGTAMSHAFLPCVVGIIIITLLQKKNERE